MKMNNLKKWRIDYRVGNTYKVKYVYASNNTEAIKRSRIKNIVDLQICEEERIEQEVRN